MESQQRLLNEARQFYFESVQYSSDKNKPSTKTTLMNTKCVNVGLEYGHQYI